MKKLVKYVLDNRILCRMISFYAVACALIILLLTTIMYYVFSGEIRKEIFRSQEQSLRQVANTVSFRAEYANSLMLQVQRDTEISRLFYSTDQKSVIDSLEAVKELRSQVKQLQSIYLYNDREDIIYYSGDNILSAINTRESFEDQGFVEILENIGAYSKYTPYLRMIEVETPGGRKYQTYVYTYLLYDTYSSGSVKNIVAFNFYLGWMQDALDFITKGENTAEKIWIVDDSRQIIFSDTGELIGQTLDTDQLPDEIYGKESGYLLTKIDGEKQMLVYASPVSNGYKNWTFLSWNSYSSLMSPLNNIRRVIYLICLFTLLCSAGVIVILSRFLYVPIRQTIDKVASLEEEQQKKKELEKVLFLRNLFLGNVKDDLDEIRNQLKQHQIDGDTECGIHVILLSVDYLNSYVRQMGDRLKEADQLLEKIMKDCFGKRYAKMLMVKMQEGRWALCVPEDRENAPFEDIFEEINSAVKEKLSITVSMAVSGIGHSMRDIPFLYSEALDVHSYLYLLGENRLITDADIQDQGKEKFEYPHEIEKKLLDNLFAGKYEDAVESYKEFVENIRVYTVEEIRLSFVLLAYAIKNTSHKSIARTSSILLEFDHFNKRLQGAGTIEEVHQLFLHLFVEVVDKLKVYSREKYEQLIEQVKEVVREEYGDVNLSMNQAAERVNMSAAYLGRLFKQVTGSTFTEYLTKFRLDMACELLKKTGKTVNDISNEVGFTNSSYFYIVFKKNMDCTPNQYRKQCDEKNEENSIGGDNR